MTSRARQSVSRRPQARLPQQQQHRREENKKKETICDKMAGFLKVLGFENKPEYTEKIPESLTDQDFELHKVS